MTVKRRKRALRGGNLVLGRGPLGERVRFDLQKPPPTVTTAPSLVAPSQTVSAYVDGQYSLPRAHSHEQRCLKFNPFSLWRKVYRP